MSLSSFWHLCPAWTCHSLPHPEVQWYNLDQAMQFSSTLVLVMSTTTGFASKLYNSSLALLHLFISCPSVCSSESSLDTSPFSAAASSTPATVGRGRFSGANLSHQYSYNQRQSWHNFSLHLEILSLRSSATRRALLACKLSTACLMSCSCCTSSGESFTCHF